MKEEPERAEGRRQAEVLLAHLLRETPWGVVAEDESGRILQVNHRFCELFESDFSPDELIGANLWTFERDASTRFSDPILYLKRLEKIRTERRAVRAEVLELASGETWQLDSLPIPIATGKPGWLHLLKDVTEAKRRKTELLEAKHTAEEAEKCNSGFLAAMSHEMRTPLSALLGLAEALDDEIVDENHKQLLTRITSNATSLLRLIEDLLDSAQGDTGRIHLSEGPFSPSESISTVIEQLSNEARKKGLILEAVVDSRLPPRVLGEEARIRQVLINLIGNALKFTDSGKIQVKAYRPEGGSPDEICYEIEDTGIGIPADKIKLVFRRFYRIRKDSPGIGLGLSICHDLVYRMGGKIGIESIEGRGTRVYFILKQPALTTADPSEFDHYDPPRLSAPVSNKQGPSVLLAEDNDDNRTLMSLYMRKAGYSVREVSSALAALPLLQAERFDALVTDISMPGMDGIQLVAALRSFEARSRRPPIPTIVVTAHPLPQYQAKAREVGVNVFLAKPVQGAILCRALGKLTRGVARILVVDDSSDSRLILKRCLEEYLAPVEVETASSGTAAVEACRQNEFSLLIMDAWMPGMSGAETLTAIRRLPGHTGIPALAVTALPDGEEMDQLLGQGFLEILRKPIDRAAVLRSVRKHLRSTAVIARQDVDRGRAPTLAALQLDSVESKPYSSESVGKYSVHVDRDIIDLVPTFLENRRADLARFLELGERQRFDEIRRLGHSMKGTGGAYGFDFLTMLGERFESAARRHDIAQVTNLCVELEDYLSRVQVAPMEEA